MPGIKPPTTSLCLGTCTMSSGSLGSYWTKSWAIFNRLFWGAGRNFQVISSSVGWLHREGGCYCIWMHLTFIQRRILGIICFWRVLFLVDLTQSLVSKTLRRCTQGDLRWYGNKPIGIKFFVILDGWYVCSYTIIPSCHDDWLISYPYLIQDLALGVFIFLFVLFLKYKTILCMSILKKELWKICINMHKQDAFANILPLYSYKLPWVKIRSQKLITLFTFLYGNHSNNTYIILCYCGNSCFETTRDVAKLARNDVIAHINVGI